MTQSELLETEAKLHVTHLADVEERLTKAGGVLTKPRVFEVNIRYEDALKSLVERGIVLRLRQDSEVRLTYKDAGVHEGGIVSRFEAEVSVSDFETMNLILNKLGFVKSMIYEKYRTTYEIENTEVVLDELPYGNFVEIEGKRDDIETVITLLELSSASRITRSYVHLFSRLQTRLNLAFNDLTFENFRTLVIEENLILQEGTN